MKGVRYKPQTHGTRAPLRQAPSRRRGVRARREREPRTAEHPAPAIHTRAQTQCMRGRRQRTKKSERFLFCFFNIYLILLLLLLLFSFGKCFLEALKGQGRTLTPEVENLGISGHSNPLGSREHGGCLRKPLPLQCGSTILEQQSKPGPQQQQR